MFKGGLGYLFNIKSIKFRQLSVAEETCLFIDAEKYRQQSGVTVELVEGNASGKCLSYTKNGAWVKYNFPQAGSYSISVTASTGSDGGFIDFYQNNREN